MFTGIVESIGKIEKIETNKSNLSIYIKSNLQSELKVDQSIAHNGICLTVDSLNSSVYRVTAIEETIEKSSIQSWNEGDEINLERCMKIGDRLDGHIVQGHVDTTGNCIKKIEVDGSWVFEFQYPKEFSNLMVEKGSITINGISLTAFNVTNTSFEVAIIPYTIEHTNLHQVEVDSKINLEFDIIGKYVARLIEARG